MWLTLKWQKVYSSPQEATALATTSATASLQPPSTSSGSQQSALPSLSNTDFTLNCSVSSARDNSGSRFEDASVSSGKVSDANSVSNDQVEDDNAKKEREELQKLCETFNSSQFYNFVDHELRTAWAKALNHADGNRAQATQLLEFFMSVLQEDLRKYPPPAGVKLNITQSASNLPSMPDWQKTIAATMRYKAP
ncbi:hypothetical protein Moror_11230 [Moniliophthora roreri MCA 2997]|uniref:Uncharacterized protein n=1 Tax=Moniliophthora roreri (strain MCA 2997) TaxID=1381753 RepID=V2WR05_MONRO|nr:hypothetical protein Moror_11230 [Moniliophthora roreri MCA 2997]